MYNELHCKAGLFEGLGLTHACGMLALFLVQLGMYACMVKLLLSDIMHTCSKW